MAVAVAVAVAEAVAVAVAVILTFLGKVVAAAGHDHFGQSHAVVIRQARWLVVPQSVLLQVIFAGVGCTTCASGASYALF